MEATAVYAIFLGATFLLWMLVTAGLSIFRLLYSYGLCYLPKHLVNRQLPQPPRGHAMITRLYLLLMSLYLAGNVTTIFFGSSTLEHVKKRTGYLAIANITPLGLIRRPNMLVDSSGVPHREQARLHKWLGLIVLVHGTTHCGINLSKKQHSLTGTIADIPTFRSEMI